jgi:predicted PurR-regulated permease PerM
VSLTIVLSPLVTFLRRRHVPRPVAVALVVVAAFAVIVAAA